MSAGESGCERERERERERDAASVKLCPKCGELWPVLHFFLKGSYMTACRVCRRREAQKLLMRRNRVREVVGVWLVKRKERAAHVMDVAEKKAMLKIITARYNYVTSVTRTRIRIMEARGGGNKQTFRALQKRQEMLRRWNSAFEKQKKMVAENKKPPDINDIF